jgi:hypothetical protein
MDSGAWDSLLDTVRKINEAGRRARSGEPGPEDYLRIVSADPVTEWFTTLLREKNQELQRERERYARLSAALRTWYRETQSNGANASDSSANAQLLRVLRDLEIVEL